MQYKKPTEKEIINMVKNKKKMKKYQLKYNNETELVVILRSDILYDILFWCGRFRDEEDLKKCSVWMDGKVLE